LFGEPTDLDGNNVVFVLYYNMVGNESTLGFFHSGDLYGTDSYEYSNQAEIFYMNLNWGNPAEDEMLRTLAHELQHMINFSNRVITNDYPNMDVWMNEGMAESAEHFVMETPSQSRINTMNSDGNHLIRNGLPLCVWGDGNEENYALVYTFMQYCRIQATNHWSIFTNLINHQNGDYTAITSIMGNENSDLSNFNSLVRGYRLAKLLGNSSGIYGYGSENSTFDLQIYTPTISLNNISLKPGGAVYNTSTVDNLNYFSAAGQGSNIRYIRIKPN